MIWFCLNTYPTSPEVIATTWPPDPGRSCESDCLPDQAVISLIPDHWILFVALVILPETKKSLTTPETLNVGAVPAVTIVLRFAKAVYVPIK